MVRFGEPIEPMTLGNMRENGVRSLAVVGRGRDCSTDSGRPEIHRGSLMDARSGRSAGGGSPRPTQAHYRPPPRDPPFSGRHASSESLAPPAPPALGTASSHGTSAGIG
jgi:hypothetical protein